MKRFILFFICCMIYAQMQGQEVFQAEYFFDSDPGVGNGVQMPLSVNGIISGSETIDISALSSGFHTWYVRVKQNGAWGQYGSKRTFYISTIDLGTQLGEVQAAEYFVNADPGVGNGVAISITAGSEVSANFGFDVSELPSGFHTMYVRTKQDGAWGQYGTKRTFYINTVNLGTELGTVQAAEYFFDEDPGVGNGVDIPITAGSEVSANVIMDISALDPGFHTMYVRTKQAGAWGQYGSKRMFYINIQSQFTQIPINRVEGFFDSDPGVGNGVIVDITPSVSQNTSVSIPVGDLAEGVHTLYFRVLDENNAVSHYVTNEFLVCTYAEVYPDFTTEIIESCANGTFSVKVTMSADWSGADFDIKNNSNDQIGSFTPGAMLTFGPFPAGTELEFLADDDFTDEICPVLIEVDYICYDCVELQANNGDACTENDIHGILTDCVCLIPDCNGDLGGTAFFDECDTCVEGNTGFTACLPDCNGDFGGTAFTDECETCVGGNTGLTPCIIVNEAIACYPFLGNAEDYIDSNNGVVNGATLTTGRLGYANDAYAFNGIDNTIVVPSGSFTEYTISSWVKFTGSPVNKSIAVFTTNSPLSSASHQIRTDGSGRFAHYTFDGNGKIVTGSTVIQQEVWYHVVITAKNGGVARLYVNGVEEGTPATIGNLWLAGLQFVLGSNSAGLGLAATGYLNGVIDDVKIFNTELTPEGIQTEFESLIPCGNEIPDDCNGVLGGAASIDECGICVGGNTGETACVEDCNGVFGSSATTDECGVCDSDPTNDNTTCLDCAGVPNGTSTTDECGVCDSNPENDNESCTDCAGIINGTATLDNCGECTGGTTGIEPCADDCAGVPGGSATTDLCGVCDTNPDNDNTTCLDCAGVPNGESTTDECGVCDSNPENDNESCTDCAGIINGTAALDNCGDCTGGTTGIEPCTNDCAGVPGGSAATDLCGVCDSDPSNDNTTCLDCAGVPNGASTTDECGVCDSDPSNDDTTCLDCAGVPNGASTTDECGVCDSNPENDNESCTDCAGIINGTAALDNCGECTGGTTGIEPCANDCAGVPGGSATTDECGVCDNDPSNDNTTCLDCAGVPNGTATTDACGVCDSNPSNDNTTCLDCAGVPNGQATTDECGVCDDDPTNDNTTCVDCAGIPNGESTEGTPCTIGDMEGVYNADCMCEGIISYDCPELSANIGDACNDGDSNTTNDTITAECGCEGVPIEPSDCEEFVYYLADFISGHGTTIYQVSLNSGIAQMQYLVEIDTEVCLAYSNDYNLIYAVSKMNNSYYVINPHVAVPVFTGPYILNGSYGEITGAAFSANNELLISSQSKNKIYSINVVDNSVSVYDGFADIIGGDLAFSADGSLFLTTNKNNPSKLIQVYPQNVMADVFVANISNANTGVAITDADDLLLSAKDKTYLEMVNTGGDWLSNYYLMLDGNAFTLGYGDMASGCNSYEDSDNEACENFRTFYSDYSVSINQTIIYEVTFMGGDAHLAEVITVASEFHIGYSAGLKMLYLVNKKGSFLNLYDLDNDELSPNVAFNTTLKSITGADYNTADGLLYIADANTGKIYTLNPDNGEVNIFKQANVFGGDLAILSNGTMVLATQHQNSLIDLTTNPMNTYLGAIPSKVTGISTSKDPSTIMMSNYQSNVFVELNASNANIITSYNAKLDGVPFILGYGDMAAGCTEAIPQSIVTMSSGFETYEVVSQSSSDILSSYPNPTTGESEVIFSVGKTSRVLLEVFDMSGRNIQTLFDNKSEKDEKHSLKFNGSALPNGIYIYKLTTENEIIIEKFIIVK